MTPDNKIDIERIPADFFKRRKPKQAQKDRKPFLGFLSWCAVLCSGGYSVFIISFPATKLTVTKN